jgi:hypothetical protein
MMSEDNFPIELESRIVNCKTEHERTMLAEAHNMCCDARISNRHSSERLRTISKACYDYGLDKMGGFVAEQADILDKSSPA